MRILDAEAMRGVDRAASEEIGIPGLVLMENAAIGVVDALGERFPAARAVAVVCGPGNNGGDGLAVARHLLTRGYDVRPLLVRGGAGLSADAAQQLAICRRLGIDVPEVTAEEALDAALAGLERCDLVVDALFGTGLQRPLAGLFARAVEALNRFAAPRLAIDLPSGLDASRGEVRGPHVEAQLTVTFAAPKIAHVFPPARDAVGELVVTDLGFPAELVAAAPGDLHLLVAEELAAYLTPRPADSHKGDFGHLLIVAGSPGKAGAAILTARGAVRGGAGLVTVGVPAPLASTVDLGSVESMTAALPARPEGGLAAAAVDAALELLAGKDALALGPGLGQDEETADAIRRLLLAAPVPAVVDADGVNAFAGRARDLAARAAPTVLTPHPGELARLLGESTAGVQADRLAAVRRAAAETGAIVVLKGHLSLVATPEGEVHVNTTGNPAMASGGSGDVLTGLIGALLAQRFEPLAAAQLGVHLHGLAGDLAADGPAGLTAGDLADALPRALARLAAC